MVIRVKLENLVAEPDDPEMVEILEELRLTLNPYQGYLKWRNALVKGDHQPYTDPEEEEGMC